MSYLCTVGVFSADSSLWESSSIDAGSDDIHSVSNNNNNNNNIYLKSDIHKMFNRLYIKTYTNNITEIHV